MLYLTTPQWSPVMKTGNTIELLFPDAKEIKPQWSPVMKTGNTCLMELPKKRSCCLNGARS